MGDMKSRDVGNLMSKGLVSLGKQILVNGGDPADIPQGAIPKAVKTQMQGTELGNMQDKAQQLMQIVRTETMGPNKVE